MNDDDIEWEIEEIECPSCGRSTCKNSEDCFANRAFYDPRIKLVANSLNPENRKKYLKMKREDQEYFVNKLIEEGIMI